MPSLKKENCPQHPNTPAGVVFLPSVDNRMWKCCEKGRVYSDTLLCEELSNVLREQQQKGEEINHRLQELSKAPSRLLASKRQLQDKALRKIECERMKIKECRREIVKRTQIIDKCISYFQSLDAKELVMMKLQLSNPKGITLFSQLYEIYSSLENSTSSQCQQLQPISTLCKQSFVVRLGRNWKDRLDQPSKQ